MNCYFCHTYLGEINKDSFFLICPTCCHSSEEFVRHIIVNHELCFVEIFTIAFTIQYVIILSLKDNVTHIDTYLDYDREPIVLQGFPINFNNVKNKLKTYLLFS